MIQDYVGDRDNLIDEVKRYIGKRYTEDISLKEISEHFLYQ